jgi:hypothetical protein
VQKKPGMRDTLLEAGGALNPARDYEEHKTPTDYPERGAGEGAESDLGGKGFGCWLALAAFAWTRTSHAGWHGWTTSPAGFRVLGYLGDRGITSLQVLAEALKDTLDRSPFREGQSRHR